MSEQITDVSTALQFANHLYQNQRYDECIEVCIKILSVDCKNAEVWNLAGIVMLELRIFDRAVEYLQEASNLAPLQFSYAINLAEAYRRWGNPQKCIELLLYLLHTHSVLQSHSTLHFNLAKAYSDMEDSDRSIKHYTIAIKLDPNDLGAMFNLANAQVNLKHFGEAIELYLSAFSKGFLDAGVNLANTYVQIGLFGKGIEVYESIYEYYKQDSDFLFNYANALNYAHSDFEKTKSIYSAAIAINPNKVDYYINYAHFHLKNHRFAEGFRIYEERKKYPDMLPKGIANLWQGESLEHKRILVYYEQGFGDTLMFSRFLLKVLPLVQNLSFLVQEPLATLFKQMGIQTYASLEEIDQSQIDIAISLLSLPLALNVSSVRDLKPTMPLQRESHPVEKDSHFRVGICFNTDSAFKEAMNKNIPLDKMMEAFVDLEEIEIHSLNKSGIDEHSQKIFHIIDRSNDMANFLDTSKIVEEMDLIISIDTALAHLSANMGKHTIVLLNKRYDWRWGNGVSTPWYDDVVCMTQSKMGNWDSVVKNLKTYLRSTIQNVKA